MKITVTIIGRETFEGVVAGETTTHYLVQTKELPFGEWFAKDSPYVFCSN